SNSVGYWLAIVRRTLTFKDSAGLAIAQSLRKCIVIGKPVTALALRQQFPNVWSRIFTFSARLTNVATRLGVLSKRGFNCQWSLLHRRVGSPMKIFRDYWEHLVNEAYLDLGGSDCDYSWVLPAGPNGASCARLTTDGL